MKARQIAPAFTSVFAIEPTGQVNFIERGAGGLWNGWQTTGTDARQIVHAGHVVARIGLDGRVSAWQRSPHLPWLTWDFEAAELTAAHLPGGAPVLFATDGDHSVWHAWKPLPTSPWSEWEPLGGPAAGLAADVIPGGGLAVFGIRDGSVHHTWQDQPATAWKEWTDLDAPPGGARALDVTTIKGGGLVVFVLGSDAALWHRWQDRPFGRWNPWEHLGERIGSFSITKTPSGGLAVFTIGLDDRVRYRRQTRPFGEWSRWMHLDGTASSIAAQPSYTDGLEVFAIGMDDEVYHAWCGRLDGPWTHWTLLERESPLGLAGDQPPGAPTRT